MTILCRPGCVGASWSLSPALVWDTSLGPVIHTLSQVILSALHYKSTSDILRIGSHTRLLAFSFTLVLSIFVEYQIGFVKLIHKIKSFSKRCLFLFLWYCPHWSKISTTSGNKDTHGINSMRLAEVWMDEYKRLFYTHRKDLLVSAWFPRIFVVCLVCLHYYLCSLFWNSIRYMYKVETCNGQQNGQKSELKNGQQLRCYHCI